MVVNKKRFRIIEDKDSDSNEDNNKIDNSNNKNYDKDNSNQINYKKFKSLCYHSTKLDTFRSIANSIGLSSTGTKNVVYSRIEYELYSKDNSDEIEINGDDNYSYTSLNLSSISSNISKYRSIESNIKEDKDSGVDEEIDNQDIENDKEQLDNELEDKDDVLINSGDSITKLDYLKFKSIPFKKFKLKRLQVISRELGVTHYGLKKDIYDRIINYLKDIHNKDVNEKIGIEDLFWKIFKTKSIIQNIFTNFNHNSSSSSGSSSSNSLIKSISVQYDDLSNVKDMLNKFSNGVNIIRDKVKSKSYLVLSVENIDLIFSNNKFKKDNSNNHQFFNQLYSYYINYFKYIHITTPAIIESLNIVALKQYIKLFTSDNSSSNSNINDIKSIINVHFNHDFPNTNQYYNIKSYQQLKKLIYYKSTSVLNKSIKFNNNNSIRISFYDILKSPSITFNQLNKIIIILINNNINNINNINNNIEDIQESIATIQFDNQFSSVNKLNLNNIISIKLNNNINWSIYEHIIKCIQLFKSISITVSDQDSMDELVEEFKQLYNEKEIQLKLDNELLLELKSLPKLIEYIISNKDSLDSLDVKWRLFNWLRGHSNSCNNNNNNSSNSLESFNQIHQELYTYDEKNNTSILEDLIKLNLEDILLEVKSNDELDYYFKHYKDIVFKENNLNWRYIKSIEQLDYYESLIKSINRSMVIDSYDFNQFKILNQYYIESPLERIKNGKLKPTIYKYSTTFQVQSYFNLIVQYFNNGNDQMVQAFNTLKVFGDSISGINFDLSQIKPNVLVSNNGRFNGMMKWFAHNLSNVKYIHNISLYILTINGFYFTLSINSNQMVQLFYHVGNLDCLYYFLHKCSSSNNTQSNSVRIGIEDQILKLNFNYNLKFIQDLIRNYLNLINNSNNIIYNYSNNSNSNIIYYNNHNQDNSTNNNNNKYTKQLSSIYKSIINKVFEYSSINGNLQMFNMLVTLFDPQVKSKRNETNGIFSSYEMKQLLISSISNQNLEVAEVIQFYVQLSKSQFISNIDNDSLGYYHFYNKFK